MKGPDMDTLFFTSPRRMVDELQERLVADHLIDPEPRTRSFLRIRREAGRRRHG